MSLSGYPRLPHYPQRPFAPGSGTSLPLLPKVPQPTALLLHPPLPGSFLPMLSPNPSSIRPLTQKCNLSISTFQRWVSEVDISLRDPCLPPAKPKAQLRPYGCSFSRSPVSRKYPTSPEAGTAWHSPAWSREGAQHGHSNLWVGATRAAGRRVGRGLALRARQLVHQLQLPFQGALDQQGYGVKQLSVLGRTSP